MDYSVLSGKSGCSIVTAVNQDIDEALWDENSNNATESCLTPTLRIMKSHFTTRFLVLCSQQSVTRELFLWNQEYVSCPSCGRTLFDLQEISAEIREKTDHLPGVSVRGF